MIKNTNGETELISLAEFQGFLFDKIVPIDDIVDLKGDNIYKSLQYWRRHGLLPFFAKGKNFELSFAQLFWIHILDQLREFSITVNNTQKICNYFFKDAYDSGLPKKNFQHNKDLLIKKKTANTISEKEEGVLKWIENALKDETLLYVLKFDINYLTNLINNSICDQEEAGILIFPNGEVLEHIGDYYFNHNHTNLDRKKPHVYFSLSYFLEEFIEKEELQSLLLPRLLSDDEKRVLKELKTKNVKELIIKLKDGKPYRIDASTEKILTTEEMMKVKKTFGLGNYEEVTLVTLNENRIMFKNTKKKHFR